MCFASGDVHPRDVAAGLFIDTCRQVLKCSCPAGDWFVFTSIEAGSLLLEASCSQCHFSGDDVLRTALRAFIQPGGR